MDVAANWAKLKQTVTYTESDSVAVVRTSENALSWLPVFLNDWSGAPHISIDGRMEPLDGIAGFERYETLKTKKLFDTATLEHWFSFLGYCGTGAGRFSLFACSCAFTSKENGP